jgi:hypothetical protein
MSDTERKKIGEINKTIRYGQSPSTKIKKIVNTPTYTTNGEYLLVVKDVEHCTITLDGYTTESIKIKVLTKTNIVPKYSLIDDQYEEIEIDNGACVELEYVDGNWYISSSDGMKLD